MIGHHRAATTVPAVLMLFVLAGGWPLVGSQEPGTISIAAASDLQAVFPDIISRFERTTRATASVSFGSSGNFFAQLQNGAPFDIFFSADGSYPKRLVDAGLADPASLYVYGVGRIVLWTRHETGIDVSRGLTSLKDARIKRVAIANPEHAPYGRAAVAALKSAGVFESVQSRLVLGENISQTAQFVESGNADVGIIALALALGPALRSTGTYFEIPASVHPPIDQTVVILNASRNKVMARQLIAYLKTPTARDLLQRYGFAQHASER